MGFEKVILCVRCKTTLLQLFANNHYIARRFHGNGLFGRALILVVFSVTRMGATKCDSYTRLGV